MLTGYVRLITIITVLLAGLIIDADRNDARAGFQAENVELFAPTSGWMVGPALLVEVSDVKVPCVMMTQYTGGITMRLSGGGSNIFAMAIDFGDDVFNVGDRFDTDIRISKSFNQTFTATAHNKSTVLVNTKSNDGFYDALRSGKYAQVTINNILFNFALLGVRDGLERLEQCYNPSAAPRTGQQAAAAPQQPKPQPGMKNISARVPKAGDLPSPSYMEKVAPTASKPPRLPAGEPLAEDDIMIPEPEQATQNTSRPAAAAIQKQVQAAPQVQPTQNVVSQVAALNEMIGRAEAALAGLEPSSGGQIRPKGQTAIAVGQGAEVHNSSTGGRVQVSKANYYREKDGTPAQAIERPLASTWVSPEVKRQNAQPQHQAALGGTTQTVKPESVQRQWRAMKGANVREVLDIWARSSSVKLIWRTENDYAVKESLSMKGSFEDAVLNILDQQQGERDVPTGRIYTEPGLGMKVLLVQSDG